MPVFVPNPTPGTIDPADLFEELGAQIANRYGLIEETMISRVATLVGKGADVPPDLSERLRVVQQLKAEGAAIAKGAQDPALIQQIIAIASADGEAAAVARLGQGARIETTSAISGSAANAIATLALDTQNSLDVMSQRITRWMPDIYQQAISMVAPLVLSGTSTIQQAQRRAAQTLIGRGVTGFTDQAGRQWRIGSYAEMATRTAVNRAWQAAGIQTMQEAGINLVSIIIGAGACQACAAHAGKVYSTDGTPAGVYEVESVAHSGDTVKVTVSGTLDEARTSGWNHPNCRCTVVAYLAGFAVPEGSRYDPDTEAARDRQRTLERRVRDLKRQQAAAFSDIERAQLGRRVRAAQADIRAHVADTGLLRRAYREQLSFADGAPNVPPPPKPRAVAPPTPPALPPAPPRTYSTISEALRAKPEIPAPLVRGVGLQGAARISYAEQTSVSKVAEALRANLGIDARGFVDDARLSLPAVKQIAQTLTDLVDEFPHVPIEWIEAQTLKASTIASAGGVKSGEQYVALRMNVSYAQLRKTAAGHDEALVRMTKGTEFQAPHIRLNNPDEVGLMRYSVTHEFGHLLDFGTLGRTGTPLNPTQILRDLEAERGIRYPSKESAEFVRTQRSNYAGGNRYEAVAEAFADVHLNGREAASELNRRIYDGLLERYRSLP